MDLDTIFEARGKIQIRATFSIWHTVKTIKKFVAWSFFLHQIAVETKKSFFQAVYGPKSLCGLNQKARAKCFVCLPLVPLTADRVLTQKHLTKIHTNTSYNQPTNTICFKLILAWVKIVDANLPPKLITQSSATDSAIGLYLLQILLALNIMMTVDVLFLPKVAHLFIYLLLKTLLSKLLTPLSARRKEFVYSLKIVH